MAALVSVVPARAETLDKVTFGTNWVAEAEHGGFFQAVADGTYKKYGLDVTIVPGGPNENNRMLLIAGKIDFFMAANTLMSFDAVANNVPVVTIAAVFQKDPQVMLTQPDAKVAKIEDLKPLTLFVSKEGMSSYFQWLKSEYGFNEKNVRPYNFNPQPFIANPKSAMQGYVTSEPFAVEKAAGFKPNVLLLADYGFNTYSTLIETRRDIAEKKPDLVQRFVDASMIGWYNYIYGDNSAGNAMIKKLNPEMTDDLLAYSVARMKEYGIVDCRRVVEERHRRHERRALHLLLQQDGEGGRGEAGSRLPQVLYAALRQQGRRRRAAPEQAVTQGPMSPVKTSSGVEASLTALAVSLRGVTKVYDNGVMALGPLDLAVRKGEFISLLGPSGCGKSTALRLIAQLSAPSSGIVRLARHEGPAQPGHGIGFVFQEPTLMPWTQRARERAAAVEACWRGEGGGARARRRSAGERRACRFRRRLSARAVRRHEDAGLAGARARHRSGYPPDG
ncbi:hypothetical protein BRDID11002_15500 [Bradyrhizobium diazoefficiens]